MLFTESRLLFNYDFGELTFKKNFQQQDIEKKKQEYNINHVLNETVSMFKSYINKGTYRVPAFLRDINRVDQKVNNTKLEININEIPFLSVKY